MSVTKKDVLTNEQAIELFNILNTLESVKGSHQELAVARTLRNMKKEWATLNNEKMQDINDEHCAIKEQDGKQILMKQTLKRTVKNKAGEDVTEEYQVPIYTKEDEKKRKEATRKYLSAPVSKPFDIHTTSDDSELSAYQKEALKDLGFLLSKDEQEAKVKEAQSKK